MGIHDGVRPFVSTSVIDECYETAREEYAAIPVYAVTDTLRYIDQRGGGKNVMRDDYRVVQTPQTFDIALAKQAFNQGYKAQFTDDASVVESLGCQWLWWKATARISRLQPLRHQGGRSPISRIRTREFFTLHSSLFTLKNE